MASERGFGVAGALDHAIVRDVACSAEAAGYRTFWANDTPGGDGLAALAATSVTSDFRLAVGVIPLDRQPPERIAARVKEQGVRPAGPPVAHRRGSGRRPAAGWGSAGGRSSLAGSSCFWRRNHPRRAPLAEAVQIATPLQRATPR